MLTHVETITVLNIDEDGSSITTRQLLWNYDDQRNTTKHYILSDIDQELLILIKFKTCINLQHLIIRSSKDIDVDEQETESSAPKQIHIYALQNLNVNFNDIREFTPDKSMKLSSKKLLKGQKVILNKTMKHTLKFKQVSCIAILIESNQRDTDKTHINGIKLMGDIPAAKGIKELKLEIEDTTDKKFKFPELDTTATDSIANHLIPSDSLLATKLLVDGYLRMNEHFYVIPSSINIICLSYYHYTIDAIWNYNHLSRYRQLMHLEHIKGAFYASYYIYKSKQDYTKLYIVKMVEKGWSTKALRKYLTDYYEEEEQIDDTTADPSYYESEINILKDPNISHPSILRVCDVFENQNNMAIFYEYKHKHHNYHTLIQEMGFGGHARRNVKYIFSSLLDTIAYLHSMGIAHRGIDCYCIWIQAVPSDSGDIDLLLTDYEYMDYVPNDGFAAEEDVTNRRSDGKLYTKKRIIGHILYMAPEIIKCDKYGYQCDIWSCGVLLYFMLCNIVGKYPFSLSVQERHACQGDNEKEKELLFKKICKGDYSLTGFGWNNVSNEGKDLIQQLLILDTNTRLTAKQALNHSFLK